MLPPVAVRRACLAPLLQEYSVVFQSRAEETLYVQTGLNASTVYHFRLRAASTKTGLGHRGPSVTVTTNPEVVNKWRAVYARAISEANAGGGRRFIDPPTDEVSMLPRLGDRVRLPRASPLFPCGMLSVEGILHGFIFEPVRVCFTVWGYAVLSKVPP